MVCTELKVYVAYMVVQCIVSGILLGWGTVFSSRMTPTYLLSTGAGILIMYFLCARGYKRLVWWLVAIAIACGVSTDLALLVNKKFKSFVGNALDLANKGASINIPMSAA